MVLLTGPEWRFVMLTADQIGKFVGELTGEDLPDLVDELIEEGVEDRGELKIQLRDRGYDV